MNPEEFIEFAESLAHQPQQRACCRSIISRAYYGVFHGACELLAQLKITTEFNHGHLQHDYRNSRNGTADEIGILLQQLGEYRVQADYRLHQRRSEDPAFAKSCLDDAFVAKDKLALLRTELQDPIARQAFVDAIAQYRKKVKRRA
jgi:uncharacterized protein (UPF0332 family)